MSTFTLDTNNGKMMGVCAGVARLTGTDVTIIRLIAVAATLIVSGVTIPLYLIAGLIAPKA